MQILLVISKPDVFKSPALDTFIIFGEAKIQDLSSQLQSIEDLSSQLQSQVAELFKVPEVAITEANATTPSTSIEDDDDGEDVDEAGVEPKDIELVITQTRVSRRKAVKALKASDGDVVGAIMDLSG